MVLKKYATFEFSAGKKFICCKYHKKKSEQHLR